LLGVFAGDASEGLGWVYISFFFSSLFMILQDMA